MVNNDILPTYIAAYAIYIASMPHGFSWRLESYSYSKTIESSFMIFRRPSMQHLLHLPPFARKFEGMFDGLMEFGDNKVSGIVPI